MYKPHDNPNPIKIDMHLHAKNDHQTEVVKVIGALVQIAVMVLIKIHSADCNYGAKIH